MPMTHDANKSVKAAWDKAPTGPKQNTTLSHYQQPHTAKNDAETTKAMDAATKAMA